MRPKTRKPKKDNLIKFRVSEEFLDAIEVFKKANPFYTSKGNDSYMFRWLILEGALKFVSGGTEWDTQKEMFVHKDPVGKALQDQISKI